MLLVVGAANPALPTAQHTTTAEVGFGIIEEDHKGKKTNKGEIKIG